MPVRLQHKQLGDIIEVYYHDYIEKHNSDRWEVLAIWNVVELYNNKSGSDVWQATMELDAAIEAVKKHPDFFRYEKSDKNKRDETKVASHKELNTINPIYVQQSGQMKIFISHASANKQYGNALVDLLRGVGLHDDEIIFTSNTAYGIPPSENIFKWLKSQISQKPFVIYLLSKEYYNSIACLNEMGAAWMIENEHAIIFTPGFDISGKEFQSGAIDPREMGFYLDNQEMLLIFIQILQKHFKITENSVLRHQKITQFLKDINEITKQKAIPQTESTKPNDSKRDEFTTPIIKRNPHFTEPEPSVRSQAKLPIGLFGKFSNEVITGKLKDEELILIHYIIETGRIKLLTGWQEQHEVDKIKVWEDINEINSLLSSNYATAVGRFELRGYTEVSAVTSASNPKEVKIKSDIADNILSLPVEILAVVQGAIDRNPLVPFWSDDEVKGVD